MQPIKDFIASLGITDQALQDKVTDQILQLALISALHTIESSEHLSSDERQMLDQAKASNQPLTPAQLEQLFQSEPRQIILQAAVIEAVKVAVTDA